MITGMQAFKVAREFIDNLNTDVDVKNLVIIEELTREESFGWVFFWDDRRYVAGDNAYGLEGNLPIVVLRETGQAMYLPMKSSKGNVDESIREFAARSSR